MTILVTIKAHTVHITVYVLDYTTKYNYKNAICHNSYLYFILYSDSLSTLMDAKKIILQCCLVHTHVSLDD
jgi:hypothetical protein